MTRLFRFRTKLSRFRLFALCLPLMASSCVFFAEEDRGGGSDTETLTGLISSPNGTPSARTAVKLIPSDYDPSHPDTMLIRRALTDESGRFRFEKLDTGKTYNVIAGKASAKTWAYAGGLKAGPGSKPLSLSLAKVFLFSLHSETYNPQDSGIAYFPGTDILTHCDGLTASKVDSVPVGTLHFVVESRAGWKHDTTLVSVKDTADVHASEVGIICAQ